MRRRYSRRREALLAVIAETAPWLVLTPSAAGLHVCAHLASDGGPTEQDVLAVADRASVGLLGLITHHRALPGHSGLVVGFSRPPEHAYRESLERLATALSTVIA